MSQKHTILLYKFTHNKGIGQYEDFNSVSLAMDGICSLYEQKLVLQNPNLRNITYGIEDLNKYIDDLGDLAVLVYDARILGYSPHNKEWIKKRLYKHLQKKVNNKMEF
jgi:hypothetical protein